MPESPKANAAGVVTLSAFGQAVALVGAYVAELTVPAIETVPSFVVSSGGVIVTGLLMFGRKVLPLLGLSAAMLTGCAKLGVFSDDSLETAAPAVHNYCALTTLAEREENRVRADEAFYPHTVRVHCRGGDE